MIALLKIYRPYIAITILVILYAVGILGLQTASKDWFLAATPLTLAISSGLLVLNQRDWNRWTVVSLFTTAIAGFLIEVVGVHTGLIFGDYAYGTTLGWKLWDVPVVIGFNWLLLVWASGTLVSRLRLPRWGQAMVAATGMTVLDFLIEPVAMRLDFWQWVGASVPLRNYFGWWLTAFVLLLFFEALPFRKQNSVAGAVLVLQFAFFGVLNILY